METSPPLTGAFLRRVMSMEINDVDDLDAREMLCKSCNLYLWYSFFTIFAGHSTPQPKCRDCSNKEFGRV